MVSKASEDLPEPLRPVITTSLSRGMVTSIFFRLLARAPLTMILSCMGDGSPFISFKCRAMAASNSFSEGREVPGGLHPPFSFVLSKRKRAVHGPKENTLGRTGVPPVREYGGRANRTGGDRRPDSHDHRTSANKLRTERFAARRFSLPPAAAHSLLSRQKRMGGESPAGSP